MTHLDDVELGRRLRALRVDPPGASFEAQLAERLLAIEPGTPQLAAGARVIIGPWLRRGPVRLIGATALLLAGAAAAMEGGVVDWVQARVLQRSDVAAPALPPAEVAMPSVRRERSPRAERPPAPPEFAEVMPLPTVPRAPLPEHSDLPEPAAPPLAPGALTPRVEPEQSVLAGARMAPLRSSRSGDDPIRVPRVAIERRSGERLAVEERRSERQLPRIERREADGRLERLREVGRQRRERGAGDRAERSPSLERLRERRERLDERLNERRDSAVERERRERGGR